MDQNNSEHLMHNMRLRVTEIERLQRENSELLKTISILGPSTAALLKRAEDTEAKLAAAEAALKLARPEIEYKRTHGQNTQAKKSARRAVDAVDAAIDAAKLVEPDYCETDETAEFLRREDAATTGVKS